MEPERQPDEDAAVPAARRSPLGLIVLLAGGLLAGGLMAVLTISGPSRTAGSGPRAAPTPIPDRLSEGTLAPDFTAQTAAGETITLSDLRGQPVAINFWATWCAPCRVEMPELESASTRYAADGLVVLALNAGEDQERVAAFMEELGLTFPAVLDPDGEVVKLYEVRVFPTTFWIDPEGIIQARHFGPLTDSLIDGYMEQLGIPRRSAAGP